ncbi:ABC transporter ATP-binding protein [Ectopseudomonas mendocina]|uniref:ABC transporter ATP-binding protein n=1 Tax=Ectopseudomonas mendocina TaxID=300 RepID=A0ABD7RVP9_ECTME|nr:ABC transporter ATP-binding protein [Pseudomonas mendocina]QTN44197.1 ABC transporter ATP-binding protein [Pseudomonas mendocina]TRO15122.1 ABC transporter ATP-binding protein [Pseudomonas mendocina]TRO18218.1 ABC transporter ATP-binding protein [Pseudomonas mendocina]
MSAVLEFKGVSHTFRVKSKEVRALRDVSFTLTEGEVFGFVGPNGAGKSTTIKVMLDIINDYQGQVSIYGVDARNASARAPLAYVPESPALYEQFTPLEILRMGLSMYGIKRSDANAWCMHWLERFSVDMNAKRRIRELSKGNVQRVALAHAMAVQPKLLVLDEPLSGLDPVGRKDVVDILTEFKQQGGAIFFTSHVLHDVERIADRFGFINKGELLTVRSPRELAAERADDMLVRYHASQPIGEPLRVLREGEFECEVLQADLPAFIAQLNQLGGHLLTIKPAVSLETVFFNILDSASNKTPA